MASTSPRSSEISSAPGCTRSSSGAYDTFSHSIRWITCAPLPLMAYRRVSPMVYSFMGYIAETKVLLEQSAPMVATSVASD